MTLRKALREINWAIVEQFYYEAMLSGWSSGKKPEASPLTGFKQHVYTDRPLRLVDAWSSTLGSDASSGMTTIYLDLGYRQKSAAEYVPIWAMHYSGFYTKEAADFVKHVLVGTYKNPNSFHGCRGWEKYERGGLKYENWIEDQGIPSLKGGPRFELFSGHEYVMKGGVCIGYHRYFGESLIH